MSVCHPVVTLQWIGDAFRVYLPFALKSVWIDSKSGHLSVDEAGIDYGWTDKKKKKVLSEVITTAPLHNAKEDQVILGLLQKSNLFL